MDHLRNLRAGTAHHIEVARAEADKLMSEAALADLYVDKEMKEILGLLSSIGRIAGPAFLHYLLDKVMEKPGLPSEGGDGNNPDYGVEDHEDSGKFEYADGEFINDDELLKRL